MSRPVTENRLDGAGSPYLEQHADNPVCWQPWDDAALEAAAEHDVPIFLSIGYSACHWCHVMEEESFEDEAVAELLNESFVPIKVDREERPDLDRIYQTVCQLVAGGGGWPLSVWLTPDGKPFYVGTYFPKQASRGRPGFIDILQSIRESWNDPEQRSEMESRAEQWTDAVEGRLEETPDVPEEMDRDPPGAETFETAVRAAIRGADREHGGFGSDGPKFPMPGRIELLLSAATQGSDEAFAMAETSLEAMAGGGLYDHVGGGFHRYAVDREWTVPHFEKMLYDNAELPRLYLAAYRYTGRDRYARVVAESLDFVERELQHDDGGFFSTLDAQSEGEEGTFYVWTPSQVEAVLDESDASLFCDRYGISESGNFERGTTVLNVSRSIDALAEEYGMDPAEVEDRLEAAREALFEARSERPRPARDEKILAGWNGLAIRTFAEAGRVLATRYADTATAALSYVRSTLYEPPEAGETDVGRLHRRVIDGEVAGEGYLEDYAFLARGAFACYETTADPAHLGFAIELGEAIVEEFFDPNRGTLYFTPESGETLVTRPQEFHDQSTPSSLGIATQLLLTLDGFRPDDRFREVAETVLSTHADRIESSPLEHLSLTQAAIDHRQGRTELTIVADEMPEAWRETLATSYLPGAVLAPRPPTAAGLEEWLDRLGLQEAPPIWADRDAEDGKPTVYACESFTCSPPLTDLDAALEWLRGS